MNQRNNLTRWATGAAFALVASLAGVSAAHADLLPPDSGTVDAGTDSGAAAIDGGTTTTKKSGCSVAHTQSGDVAAWLLTAGATAMLISRRKKA